MAKREGAGQQPQMGERDREPELAEQLAEALQASGIPDALMLRKVLRAREQIRDVDELLAELQKYFTAGAP